jgi:hypothetical protein
MRPNQLLAVVMAQDMLHGHILGTAVFHMEICQWPEWENNIRLYVYLYTITGI